ncbi:MAG: hypothetical protein U0Y10_04835 [Spirosomataceae bacterium]
MKNPIVIRLVTLIPIALFFTYFGFFAVDAPWFDDFEAFPAFLLDYLQAPSIAEKLRLLFKPNNEHRILFGKLVTVLGYAFSGKLDYRWLMLVGNLCIIGIWWILMRIFERNRLNPWFGLPLVLLLFQPHYHLLTFWAITSLQHQPTAFLVLLSLYCLVKKSPKSFVLSLLLMVIATFSMSNGMFGWVAGCVVLLVQGRYKTLAGWGICMVVAVMLYFHGFTTQGNEAGFTFFKQHPHLTIFAFFAFVGGFLDLIPSHYEPYRFALPIVFGGLLSLFLGIRLWKMLVPSQWSWRNITTRWQQIPADQLFLVGGLIYLILNALVVAILRPRFGFGVLVVSNYKLYPTLFVTLCYALWALQVPKRQSLSSSQRLSYTIGLGLVLLLNALAYLRFTPEVQNRHRNLVVNCFNQRHNQVGLGGMVNTPLARYIDSVMQQSIRAGHYRFPTNFYTSYETELFQKPSQETSIPALRLIETQENFSVQHLDYQNKNLSDDALYILLKSDKRTFLFYTQAIPYQGRNPFKSQKGVVAFVPRSMLYEGQYQVGLLIVNGSEHELVWTNQRLKK